MTNALTRPAHDEVELSAFGPGYGECILVHLGNGDWMIVDSCVGTNGQAPVLEYLTRLGVDAAEDVKLVVATHWHDDHVRGIAEILSACRAAAFACSAVLNSRDLIEGIGSLRSKGRLEARHTTSGIEEMQRILDLLEPDTGRPAPMWTSENSTLMETKGRLGYRVHALAPSNRVLSDAYEAISDLLLDGERRVREPSRNHGAVVLWVQVGDIALLLGSDLQETSHAQTGWTGVLGCRSRPAGQAEVFKVPHHGSENGHQQKVWDQMLVDSPQAVVCPWSLAGRHLPSEADVERLCGLGQVHITAPAHTGTVVPLIHGRPSHEPAITSSGRVTLRRSVGGTTAWSTSYDPPATTPCREPHQVGT